MNKSENWIPNTLHTISGADHHCDQCQITQNTLITDARVSRQLTVSFFLMGSTDFNLDAIVIMK